MFETTRALIVNADDFGLSAGVNDGVQRAFVDGIVTSASLMVRQSAAADAAAFARAHPTLSVGLHLDLGEWTHREGEWVARYEVVDLGDGAAVRREVAAQLEAFGDLMEREPTHIDSHQHVHFSEPIRGAVEQAAGELGIPVRGLDWGGFGPRVGHSGAFYGQTGIGEPAAHLIAVENLLEIIDRLPEGWTELGCHPGDGADDVGDYGSERVIEVQSLTDPRVRDRLETVGVDLVSFHDHRRVARGSGLTTGVT